MNGSLMLLAKKNEGQKMVRDKEGVKESSEKDRNRTLVSGLFTVYFKESKERNFISGFHEDDFHFEIQD